jgi:uncharacterized protein YdeI (YjbR/CyaY-like superfamily)
MNPTYFKTQAEFRRWLQKIHNKAGELLVGFYKKGSGKGGITYQQALDEALCLGWIDGVRRRIDDERWSIRFSPRNPRSGWSRVNIKRVNELDELGLMRPSGLKAFEGHESRTTGYMYEEEYRALGPDLEKRFRQNKKAWKFWEAQPPGYRRTASWYVMSAKRDETRLTRLATIIEESKIGRRLDFMAPRRKTK